MGDSSDPFGMFFRRSDPNAQFAAMMDAEARRLFPGISFGDRSQDAARSASRIGPNIILESYTSARSALSTASSYLWNRGVAIGSTFIRAASYGISQISSMLPVLETDPSVELRARIDADTRSLLPSPSPSSIVDAIVRTPTDRMRQVSYLFPPVIVNTTLTDEVPETIGSAFTPPPIDPQLERVLQAIIDEARNIPTLSPPANLSSLSALVGVPIATSILPINQTATALLPTIPTAILPPAGSSILPPASSAIPSAGPTILPGAIPTIPAPATILPPAAPVIAQPPAPLPNAVPIAVQPPVSLPITAPTAPITPLFPPAQPIPVPISEPIIPPVLQSGTAQQAATAIPLGTLTTTMTNVSKRIFGFIPFFLAALYSSKEDVLQNINIGITATDQPKVYTIGFGQYNGDCLNLSFEVRAGEPIRFLQEKAAARYIEKIAPPIFKSQTWISKIPGLNIFEWKRQIYHTEAIITVDDPHNPLLGNGPKSVYVPLSENEGFRVIHRDPNLVKNLKLDTSASDYVVDADDTFASLSTVSVQVTAPKSRRKSTQVIPLPFDNSNHFVSITQH